MTREPSDATSPVRGSRRTEDDDKAVLPQVTSDERDVGWGDEPDSGRRDADWYRHERPPHHE